MINDPNEFTNLTEDPRLAAAKSALKERLPKINKKPVPGRAKRILIYKNGVANWEGEDIDPTEAIPD
jgi:choline-sulfatase